MKTRAMVTLTIVVLMLTMVGACGNGDKALDVDGLNLGKDMTGMIGDLTKMLGGITESCPRPGICPPRARTVLLVW